MLALFGVTFATLLLRALSEARKELADGMRRDHLTLLKHSLETYFNVGEVYPASPTEPRIGCTSNVEEHSWLFGQKSPLRAASAPDSFPRDPTFPANWSYQYCVTAVDNQGATAWYLRTRLERLRKPTDGFDVEADHNYYYRVVREGSVTFFDICGGTLTCGAPPKPPD